jgi:hypothetical protein
MDQRFATDKKEVSDVVFEGDVDNVTGFLEGDTAALPGVETVDGKAAKIAFGVANVGYGELQVAGTAMIEHVADEPGPANSREDNVSGRFQLANRSWQTLRQIKGRCAHD